MINRLGIIPAAGIANRFGGVLKELLPLHENETFLQHTLNAMAAGYADACLLVTNRDKLTAHAKHCENWQLYYAVQFGGQDLWSAVVESLPIHGAYNMLAMPDTYYPQDIFSGDFIGDLIINYFETDKPERFGVITEQGIVDKYPLEQGHYKAWGTLIWSYRVAELWIRQIKMIKDFPQALNMAIDSFGFTLNQMDFYHDLATIEDYRRLINV